VEQDFEHTYTAVAAANRGLLAHLRGLLSERA
jgi:hypothetical protein